MFLNNETVQATEDDTSYIPVCGPGDSTSPLYPRHILHGDQRLSIFCFIFFFPIIITSPDKLNKCED